MKPILVLALLAISAISYAQALKNVDHKGQTAEVTQSQPSSAPTLTPEETQELKLQVEQIKKNQLEAQKYLEELDKEP